MRQFLNDAVKPWDELNVLLAKPFAYQPEISDITRLANTIAVAIKNQSEHWGATRLQIDNESLANRLMSDVADGWKHGGQKLRDDTRHNSMVVVSRFEVDEANQFRFIRNRVVIEHASLGNVDFMVHARDAIRYWLQKMEVAIQWGGQLLSGPLLFQENATVYYDPRQQIGMDSARIEMVRRHANGEFQFSDVESIKFILLDCSGHDLDQRGELIADHE
jgi:hypothetical protein